MLIAKLRISLMDAAIQYNRSDELGTDKVRGTVLADGKVIRGLGTHFLNAEAQKRFDKLTSESNAIREKFNRRFLRSPIDGVYVIGNKGEAKEFVKALTYDGGLVVGVTEFELGNTNGGLDSMEMTAWAGKVKTQLEKIPLGRGKKETIDPEGIAALEALSKCPVLSAETASAISALAVQAKANQCDRVELKRSIELLTVTMDQGSLDLTRGGKL